MQERDVIGYIAALVLLDDAMGKNFKRPDEVAYIQRYRHHQGIAVGHICMKHAHGRAAQHKLTRRAVDMMHRVRDIPEAKEFDTGDVWLAVVHLLTILEHPSYKMDIGSQPLLALGDYIRSAQALMRDDKTKKIFPVHASVIGLSMAFLRAFHAEKCFRAIDTEALAA